MRFYDVFFRTNTGSGVLMFESEHRKGSRRNREDAIHALHTSLGWSGAQGLQILDIRRV